MASLSLHYCSFWCAANHFSCEIQKQEKAHWSPQLGPVSPVLMLKEMRSVCRCYTSVWEDISVVIQAKIKCVICIFLTPPAQSVAAIPPQWDQILLFLSSIFKLQQVWELKSTFVRFPPFSFTPNYIFDLILLSHLLIFMLLAPYFLFFLQINLNSNDFFVWSLIFPPLHC